MPYIDQKTRMDIDPVLNPLINKLQLRGIEVGVLNYVITRIIACFLVKLSYAKLNNIIGVLECVKLELSRRVLAPHEDKKKEENGDVY